MKRQPRVKRGLVVGVTGSFGSGKSTAARLIARGHAEVIDADGLSHACLLPATATYRKIIRTFGRGILDKRGRIDRPALGRSVFSDSRKRKMLNAIIHPVVIREIRRRIAGRRHPLVIDVPLLIEAGLDTAVDVIVAVTITRAVQLRRLQSKWKMPEEELLRRIHAQMPQRGRLRFADFIIDNNGPLTETKKKIQAIRRQLWIS